MDEKILQPKWSQLIACLSRLRQELDTEYQQRAAEQRPSDTVYGELNLSQYPLGFCRHIRNGMLEKMRTESFFRELVQQGVRIHPVFILLKGSYFQNAIQIGNTYLDVANDTVDVTKPSLEWAPIAEVAYTNLHDWETFVAVAERYLRVQIFPNFLFPLAFPAIPFFAVRPNGRLDFLYVQNQIFLKDLGRQMSAVRHLIKNPKWMGRHLPDVYSQLVEKRFGANIGEVLPFEYQPASAAEILDSVVSEFAQLNLDRAKDHETVLTYLGLLEQTAKRFTEYQLIPADDDMTALRAQGVLPNSGTTPVRPNQELIGFDDEA